MVGYCGATASEIVETSGSGRRFCQVEESEASSFARERGRERAFASLTSTEPLPASRAWSVLILHALPTRRYEVCGMQLTLVAGSRYQKQVKTCRGPSAMIAIWELFQPARPAARLQQRGNTY